MTFFQGATDVKINGGEFTVVNGNYTVFDQSRHTSNVNSFNTTNSTILGSYNDNSQRYYNQRGQRPPSLARRARVVADDEYPINEHFSPPLVHPSLGSTHNLPPGSTINNRDSFNLSNNDVGSSYKDNPRPYGAVLFSGHFEARNPSVGSQANSYHRPYSSPVRDTSSTASHITATVTADSQSRPFHVSADTSSSSSASFAPEEVTYTNAKMKQAMSVIMREAIKATASASGTNPLEEYGYYTEEESGDSSDSEEEIQTSRHGSRDPVNIRHGLAPLSPEDPSTRPSFSQNKSAPHGPTHYTSHANLKTGAMDDNIPRYPNSTPSFPEDKADGYAVGQRQASWHLQPSQSYPANPATTAFGSAAISSPNVPVFNTFNGPYTKYDNRHHISNIGSGNTSNTLIKDSFNDQSLQALAPSEPKKFKGLGKKSRRNV